jgi:hypothetical protein
MCYTNAANEAAFDIDVHNEVFAPIAASARVQCFKEMLNFLALERRLYPTKRTEKTGLYNLILLLIVRQDPANCNGMDSSSLNGI